MYRSRHRLLFVTILLLSTWQLQAQNENGKTLLARQDQFEALIAYPDGKPVMMVNFVKFKKTVAENGKTGKEQFKEYIKEFVPFAKKAGAKLVWYGSPKLTVVGPATEVNWDLMFVVRFEAKSKFMEMIQSEGFPSNMRLSALDDSRFVLSAADDEWLVNAFN